MNRANAFGTGLSQQAVELDRLRPAAPLLFGAALATAKPSGTRPLSLSHLRDPVLGANQSASPGIAAVHPPVLSRVNGAEVFRPATAPRVATVMNVLPGGSVKGLINEAVNLSQPPVDPDVAIPLLIAGAGPKPAFADHGEARIEAGQIIMREHTPSIYKGGLQSKPLRASIPFAGEIE